jgi:Ca-activated chloride channel homolog
MSRRLLLPLTAIPLPRALVLFAVGLAVYSLPGICNLLAQAPTPESLPSTPSQGTSISPAAHPSEAQTKIRVNSDLVVLPVTVKDEAGELVAGLQQSDFRVFDNDIEQSLDIFTAEAFPLSLVVLIDDDLKSKDAAQMAPTLRAIIAGISANDEALICRFDLDFHPGDAFTADLDQIWSDLKNAQVYASPSTAGPVPSMTPSSDHPAGVGEPTPKVPVNAGARPTKALDDAIHSAAQLLHDRGIVRRKIVLIISDGANGTQFNHHTYADNLEILLRDNVSVYSLAVGSSLTKHKFSRLVSYADDTGGDVYFASTSAAMERLYSQITEQARHEYTLAYVPRGANRNSAYHKLEVRVTRPGATVKTRQGYYTTQRPPASPPPSAGNASDRR